MFRATIVAVTVSCLLVRAEAQTQPGPAATPKPATAADAPAPAGDAAYVAFAKKVEAGIAAGNGAALDANIDMAAIAESATAGINAPPAIKRGYIDGMKGSMPLGAQIVREVQSKEHSYRFLRLRQADGKTTALYRLVGPNGLNYHEMTLSSGPGPVRIVDILMYVTGEPISRSLRRNFTMMLAAQERGDAAAKAVMADVQKLNQMNQLVRQGKAAEAMAVYDTMSPRFQGEKLAQMLRLLSASKTDPATYATVLDDYRKRFKDDPTADLLSIDAHLLAGEHDKSLASIDRLDKSLGGDPYLDVMRGNILFVKGDVEGAKKRGASAAKADPTLYGAYDLQLSVAMKTNDHAETARVLGVFEEKFGLQFGDLSGSAELAAFRASPEYKKWMAHKRPAAPAPK